MPITQDRMIAVINAGLDYRAALDRALADINAIAARIHRGSSDPFPYKSMLDIADDIAAQFAKPSFFLRDKVDSQVTLTDEFRYFRRNQQRNKSAREWMQRKRKGEGKSGQPARRITDEEFIPPIDTHARPTPVQVPRTGHIDVSEEEIEQMTRLNDELLGLSPPTSPDDSGVPPIASDSGMDPDD